ncbi:hypothetical protein KAI52_02625 [Candidatus Parcubacteria bacterium]|nr:hypothetical protein [Candidatus Parcubacteria bacterium]
MGKKWERKKYDGKGSFSKINPTVLIVNARRAPNFIGISKPVDIPEKFEFEEEK